MNYINPTNLVDVRIEGKNIKFKFVSGIPSSFNYPNPYFKDPVVTELSIECPEIVKQLEEYPIMSQIIGDLRAEKINLSQELIKVKKERDILLNTLGKLTHD